MNEKPAPLRILYHHRTQGRGAEGHHIVSVVKAMRELGHEVDVLSPAGIDPFALINQPPVDKAETSSRGIQRLWTFISRNMPNFLFELMEIGYNVPAWFRLRKTLKATRYDAVYERYAFYLVAGAIAAKRAGIPFLLEANEVTGIPDRARKQAMPNLCAWFERRLFKRTTVVFTVSSYLKQLIGTQHKMPPRVCVTPNAIEPEKFARPPAADVLAGLRHKLGIEGNDIIGFAGWFDAWDRIDFLIEVFADLLESHPDTRLLLIGDGPVTAGLRNLADELGVSDKVVFTGAVPRSEIYNYLSLLDIAVLPHSNPFGSPVILFEFMGLRIPAICPDLLPITDVLENERTGLIFPPLDKQACSTAILSLLDSPERRQALAGAAHTELLEQHTWVNNAQTILATLER